MSEENWTEIRVRKVMAVVKCLICGNLNRNEDYGDKRMHGKILIHCTKCNVNRQHVVVEKIMEVAGMVDQVTEETIVDLKTPVDSTDSEEPE